MNSLNEAKYTKNLLAKQRFMTFRRIYSNNTLTNFLRNLMVFFIKAYRYWISPFLPASCRFYPSCSVYALESYQRLGFWKGTYLISKRILKCHPFHPGGVDLVPRDNARTYEDCSSLCGGK